MSFVPTTPAERNIMLQACGVSSVAELFSVIASLSQEIAVLFIEHDMNVVFRFAHRIIVMAGGRILMQGTAEEIAADARVREVYLGRARHG